MGVRILKPREIIRILEANGWRLTRQKGSHKHFKKAGYVRIATVPDHAQDVSDGGIRSLYEATGLDDFII